MGTEVRQETEKRLKAAAGLVGGFRAEQSGGRVEAGIELHLVKIEYRIEKMFEEAPSPITPDQRDRICAFLSGIPS